ncbi:hypothetical protein [Ornithinimicrobium sp. INDO-MA30-4]|uniref:hypothetical protein n=1 Tax=Ornithinimicrobium sp. INDO-MA30-4 TaxID=2908651 RepID=UPI001F4108D4|nr:hypothetical protein [Ornithinimicrobium sp. INDO-MA30-4]UJH71358.1 hypothetical protein L0A91_06320 [Ornithinimicrobium sp. INDO-MA30-4]
MANQTEAGPSPRKRSKGALTSGILSTVIGIAGVTLLVLGVVGLNQVPVANLNGFNDGQTINVTDSGMSVYALDDVRDSTVCQAVVDGNTTVFDRPVESFSIEVSGSDYYEIARTPDGMAAGSYEVACESGTSTYAGPRATLMSSGGVMGLTGVVVGVVLVLIAGVLLLLAVALAFNNRRKAKKQQGGQPASGYPESGYAQSGYTSPYASPPPPPMSAPEANDNYPYSQEQTARDQGAEGDYAPYGQQTPQESSPYGNAQAAPGPYGSQSAPPPPPPSTGADEDPYGPPPTSQPYGQDPTQPVGDETQQMPMSQSTWAPPADSQSADETTSHEPSHDSAESSQDHEDDRDDSAADETESEEEGRQASGNGYGPPPTSSDKPSQGLGYGNSWPPPPPPSNS